MYDILNDSDTEFGDEISFPKSFNTTWGGTNKYKISVIPNITPNIITMVVRKSFLIMIKYFHEIFKF
jgi:hypothetical protein